MLAADAIGHRAGRDLLTVGSEPQAAVPLIPRTIRST